MSQGSGQSGRKFYGKYRGTVAADGDDQGRLRVIVPDINPDSAMLAEPCVPFLGQDSGILFLPPLAASVWVEFEQGDLSSPIWTGCAFPRATKSLKTEVGFAAGKLCLQTAKGGSIVLDDDAGKLTLKSGNSVITISDDGIEITNGKGASIKLSNRKVAINDNALEIE